MRLINRHNTSQLLRDCYVILEATVGRINDGRRCERG
jgi:hypothetical protein